MSKAFKVNEIRELKRESARSGVQKIQRYNLIRHLKLGGKMQPTSHHIFPSILWNQAPDLCGVEMIYVSMSYSDL